VQRALAAPCAAILAVSHAAILTRTRRDRHLSLGTHKMRLETPQRDRPLKRAKYSKAVAHAFFPATRID
jgi:hypothetical protein